jgi:predicted RNA-binding protein associated with RNAse of E/G family
MTKPKLYRRRFIPDELIELKNDEILRVDDEIILTRWNVLKPRNDFTHGESVFFLKRGWKISRFYDANDNCVYIYCDIIEIVRDECKNAILFNDLLVDVIVYENGMVKVLDLGEMADAIAQKLISSELAVMALRRLEDLLQLIYAGRLTKLLEEYVAILSEPQHYIAL